MDDRGVIQVYASRRRKCVGGNIEKEKENKEGDDYKDTDVVHLANLVLISAGFDDQMTAINRTLTGRRAKPIKRVNFQGLGVTSVTIVKPKNLKNEEKRKKMNCCLLKPETGKGRHALKFKAGRGTEYKGGSLGLPFLEPSKELPLAVATLPMQVDKGLCLKPIMLQEEPPPALLAHFRESIKVVPVVLEDILYLTSAMEPRFVRGPKAEVFPVLNHVKSLRSVIRGREVPDDVRSRS